MESDRQYLINALHDVIRSIDRYEASGDVCTDFQAVILKLDYVQRIVVNLGIDESISRMVGETMRMLMDLHQNNQQIDAGTYRVSVNRGGPRGRPYFNISEEQLVFLLEFGFKVNDISNFLGVSKRTVERRMSTFGLSVSGKYYNSYK